MEQIFLNFHGVGEPTPESDLAERKFWWDEAPFLSALDGISEVMSRPPSAVRLTFDDGNASDVKIVLPALVKRGMTGWFFVCAGRIGMRGYLDVAAIRDLLSAGMRIGSHGMYHRDWRTLDDADLEAEIGGAKRILEDVCGAGIDDVSIPFGSYDRRVLTKVRSERYYSAYTSDGGTVRPGSWLKTRNTLDRSWQWRNVLEGLEARDSFARRLRRALVGRYKMLR
jgi:peptidoglycan/xylan/chitin deacetylase (PgdA/CDA1 family)